MITNPFLSMHISLICPLPLFYYILVNKRNDTKIFFKYIFMLKPKTIVYYHLRQCLRETRLQS
jgi:hypothetical protein